MRSWALGLLFFVGANAQQLEFLKQKTTGLAARDAQGNWIFAEPVSGDVRVRKTSADFSQTVFDVTTGGSGVDGVRALQVDVDGNAYVIGSTASTDFPITPGARWTSGQSFFLRVNATGVVTNSSYLPLVEPHMVAADGDWIIVGTVAAGLSMLRVSGDATELRGARSLNAGGVSTVSALQRDPSGNLFLAGSTSALDLPITPGAFQSQKQSGVCVGFGFFPIPYECSTGFAMKLDSADFHTIAATYLGGTAPANIWGLAVDAQGSPYVTGSIARALIGPDSRNYPVTPNAFQTKVLGNGNLPFVTKLTPDLSALVYSTFLGGSGRDTPASIAVDDSGRAVISGISSSTDFPVTGRFGLRCTPATFNMPSVGFVARLSVDGSALESSAVLDAGASVQFLEGGDPVVAANDLVRVHFAASGPVAACTVNGGNYRREGFVGANQLITVKGGPFPPQTKLLFDGEAAPLLYVGDSQINAVAPASVAGRATTLMEIDVDGARSNARQFTVKAPNPTVKIWLAPDGSVDNRGNLLADVALSDGSPNTEDNPAHLGEVVTIYVTGLDLSQPISMRLNLTDAPILRVSERPGSFGGVIGLDVRIPGPVGGMYVISIQNGASSTADNPGFIWTGL